MPTELLTNREIRQSRGKAILAWRIWGQARRRAFSIGFLFAQGNWEILINTAKKMLNYREGKYWGYILMGAGYQQLEDHEEAITALLDCPLFTRLLHGQFDAVYYLEGKNQW